MSVTFRDRGPQVSEHDVVALERRLKVRLPEDYRRFLLTQNGGKPSPRNFLDTAVGFFYSLGSTQGAVDLVDKICLFEPSIPKRALAVARDTFGNQVLLFLHGDSAGQVHFWDHEDDSMQLVAASFDQFIELLSDESETQ